MSNKKNANQPEDFKSKDRWTILALLSLDHIPTNIEPIATGDYNVLVYHFAETAWTDYEAWMRGERTGDFSVIRKVKASEDLFKNNLHRYSR